MKKILGLLVFISITFSQDVSENSYLMGGQIGSGSFWVGSEILQYDVVGGNAPENVQGDPTFTLKPELGFFFRNNLAFYAKYYKENGLGTEYGLGLMYTMPDFYINGVFKNKDADDQHIQGTIGKLFQLETSPAYLTVGLNYSLYSEDQEKQLQLLIKGLYVGFGMTF